MENVPYAFEKKVYFAALKCNILSGSKAKANRVLPRERTGHSKHPLPTTQEKTLHVDIIR